MDRICNLVASIKGWRHLQLTAFLIVVVAAAYGNYVAYNAAQEAEKAADGNSALIAQQTQERQERTDQACTLFERDHKADVREYRAEIRGFKITTEFLAGLTPEQRQEPLNALIQRELPRAERDLQRIRREATVDTAPEYCDEPGIGLKEPDPKLPKDPFVNDQTQ